MLLDIATGPMFLMGAGMIIAIVAAVGLTVAAIVLIVKAIKNKKRGE